MSEETIVRQAAPTLAGIKTGSMFPYRFENHAELLEDIRAFNRVLVPRGMCLLLLRVMEKSALLYLYRPQSLEKDLKDHISQELLQESGYASESCAACGKSTGTSRSPESSVNAFKSAPRAITASGRAV